MPLLCYCIIEEGNTLSLPAQGVLAAPLRLVDVAPVQIVTSEWPPMPAPSQENAVERALEFHRVIHAIFEQVQVIQFRFPTTLEDEAALRGHIEARAAASAETLRRFRTVVQMEVRLRGTGPAAAAASGSGTEYLQSRRAEMRSLEQGADRLREAAGSIASEWRQRWSSAGLRCYALVERERVADFRRAFEATAGSAPQARVSGPWPPAEFMGDL